MLTFLVAFAVLLASCDEVRKYDRYRGVSVHGWDREDSLTFDTSPLQRGDYQMNIGIRATQLYPFKDLGLTLNWTVYPSRKEYHKELKYPLFDNDGRLGGRNGISNSEFLFYATDLHVNKGDSLHITITHNMNQQVIQGITDVGVQLLKR